MENETPAHLVDSSTDGEIYDARTQRFYPADAPFGSVQFHSGKPEVPLQEKPGYADWVNDRTLLRDDVPLWSQVNHEGKQVLLKLGCIMERRNMPIPYDVDQVRQDYLAYTEKPVANLPPLSMFVRTAFPSDVDYLLQRFQLYHNLSTKDCKTEYRIHQQLSGEQANYAELDWSQPDCLGVPRYNYEPLFDGGRDYRPLHQIDSSHHWGRFIDYDLMSGYYKCCGRELDSVGCWYDQPRRNTFGPVPCQVYPLDYNVLQHWEQVGRDAFVFGTDELVRGTAYGNLEESSHLYDQMVEKKTRLQRIFSPINLVMFMAEKDFENTQNPLKDVITDEAVTLLRDLLLLEAAYNEPQCVRRPNLPGPDDSLQVWKSYMEKTLFFTREEKEQEEEEEEIESAITNQPIGVRYPTDKENIDHLNRQGLSPNLRAMFDIQIRTGQTYGAKVRQLYNEIHYASFMQEYGSNPKLFQDAFNSRIITLFNLLLGQNKQIRKYALSVADQWSPLLGQSKVSRGLLYFDERGEVRLRKLVMVYENHDLSFERDSVYNFFVYAGPSPQLPNGFLQGRDKTVSILILALATFLTDVLSSAIRNVPPGQWTAGDVQFVDTIESFIRKANAIDYIGNIFPEEPLAVVSKPFHPKPNDKRYLTAVAQTKQLQLDLQKKPNLINAADFVWEEGSNSCWIDNTLNALFRLPGGPLEKQIFENLEPDGFGVRTKRGQATFTNDYPVSLTYGGMQESQDCQDLVFVLLDDIHYLQTTTGQSRPCKLRLAWNKCMRSSLRPQLGKETGSDLVITGLTELLYLDRSDKFLFFPHKLLEDVDLDFTSELDTESYPDFKFTVGRPLDRQPTAQTEMILVPQTYPFLPTLKDGRIEFSEQGYFQPADTRMDPYYNIDAKQFGLVAGIVYIDGNHYSSYVRDVATDVWWRFDSMGEPRRLVAQELVTYTIEENSWNELIPRVFHNCGFWKAQNLGAAAPFLKPSHQRRRNEFPHSLYFYNRETVIRPMQMQVDPVDGDYLRRMYKLRLDNQRSMVDLSAIIQAGAETPKEKETFDELAKEEAEYELYSVRQLVSVSKVQKPLTEDEQVLQNLHDNRTTKSFWRFLSSWRDLLPGKQDDQSPLVQIYDLEELGDDPDVGTPLSSLFPLVDRNANVKKQRWWKMFFAIRQEPSGKIQTQMLQILMKDMLDRIQDKVPKWVEPIFDDSRYNPTKLVNGLVRARVFVATMYYDTDQLASFQQLRVRQALAFVLGFF